MNAPERNKQDRPLEVSMSHNIPSPYQDSAESLKAPLTPDEKVYGNRKLPSKIAENTSKLGPDGHIYKQ
jgi:hypothetical protein